MKKLLKGALSLALIAAVGTPQINASTPTYQIEVKSKKYSKQTTKKLYGLVYTEAYTGYGDANWPLVECYTPFVEANDAFIATDGSGTTKKFLIRQFGVSMGVVYWINPTQNVIHYWNTFTGEVGTDTPEKGLRGSATPSKHKGLNYACGDIPGQTGFAYPFSGAQTGVGSVTQDWGGNIIHQWNNVSGANINTPTQGFAVYRAPEKYGQLIDFEPRLSDMTTQTMPYKRRKIGSDGKLIGTTTAASNYSDDTTPNPNWVGNQVNWNVNEYYHAWSSDVAGSVKKPVDFLGASGYLFDNAADVPSEYFRGNWGGQIFFTYGGITYGSMFADGQYANWYLNYDLYANSRPIDNVEMTQVDYSVTVGGVTTSGKKYKPGAYSMSTYPREYMFREYSPLEYFWILPVTGSFEMVTKPTYKWTFDPRYYETSDGTINSAKNVVPYLPTHERYLYTMSRGYDGMNVPEVDSIKGNRVLIHNMWLQYWPENVAFVKNGKTFNMRDGQIQIRTCPYSGSFTLNGTNADGSPNQWPGKPNHAYAQVGYGYGYNKQTNDYVNVLGTNFTATNTSVNCWNELERVNDNVLALYTNVPGKGFSKYYITAVEQDNPVTIKGVTQKMDVNNNIINTISWTPQEHDRGTIHRYQVYYRVKKSGASVYEKAETIDGATQYPWTLAGVTEYEGKYAGQTFTFDHNAPYGGTNINNFYDRVYEYMVMPIYDASSHFGTESSIVTKTSAVPDCYLTGTFKQVTDNGGPNGETRYSFNVQLDPTIMAGTPSITTLSRMIIEPLDATTAAELKKATSITTSAGTATAKDGSTTFTANGASVTTSNNYYVEVTGFTVGADGKLPSIVWHNVDPDMTYKIKVYVEDTPTAFVLPSGEISTTLVVPCPTLSLTEVSVYPLLGDYSSIQNDDLLPLGAQRRVGSKEVTNPVTLSNANTIGTKGSAINPLLVTDEVMENWSVQYRYNIMFSESIEGRNYMAYDLEPSNTTAGTTYYSNSKKVIFDIVGLPVERTAWDTHTKMGLDDAQKATNDNLTKYGYNTATTNHNYTAHIDVTYTRKDNGEIKAVVMGENIASSPLVYSEGLKNGSVFPNLGVNFGSQFVALKRDNIHWDENCAENEGYFSVYYDAVAQWSWGDYIDNLNRYVGYHAVTSTNCVGHYVNNSTTWIPYYAPSVLSDYYVEQTNISLGKAGNFTDNYNGEVEPLVMYGIGYDGSAKTNWSALAAKERKLPMQVHYVWGGNRELTNVLTDRESTSTKMLMTADYPIIESIYGATIIHNAVAAINDDEDSYYTLIEETNAGVTRMNMISSENHSGVYVDYVTTLTGVEGILVNAAGGVKLYPNPVGSTFTLQAPMAMGEVKIFTMDGQLVKVVKDINDTMVSINVDELPQGMYIVNTLGVAKMMIKE
ncbi:MAG: T9SS type A sorting domain-containing protein [Muribaculaceae bacterium]|nr:T9SS type A sorting domain-containing protein [Muribaculaceae bacterium]